MNVQEWLGQDNTIGQDIWEKKYCNNNETFENWLDRVSGGNNDVKQLIQEKKFLFGGRILANRGLDKKLTYSNCFTGETKIATKKGLKTLRELVDEDDLEVFSEGTWRSATVQSFGKQPVKILTVSKKGATETFRVTGDHIWFVRDDKKKSTYYEIKTDDLKKGMRLRTDATKCYRTYKPSPFGVAHGFFYGDGDHTSSNNQRRVNFCGDKTELIPYFTPDTVGNSGGVTTICGIPKIFWDKPSLEETKSYLYGWLAGYFAADGSVDMRGACVICSSKKEDLEFVQDILCVLGIPANVIRQQTRVSNLTGEEGVVYILSLERRYLNENFFVLSKHKERFLNAGEPHHIDNWLVENVSDVVGVEEVYCAVVPETASFALEHNILTHNCYVIAPPEDNIESIYETCAKLARTFSYGGGVGIDISKLAPAGARVNNAAKTTSGAVSFMETFSQVTGQICQRGRRGALMISLDCTHPDLEEFITIKTDLSKVNFANISVRITDDFMDAVINDRDWVLFFERKETDEKIEKTVKAKDIFRLLCKTNWDFAEPKMLGMQFNCMNAL